MTARTPVRHLAADELAQLVPPARAVAEIEDALRRGLDPEAEPPRWIVPVEHGEILTMLAHGARYAGVKVATVAPSNADAGLPSVQGSYLLFDARTLSPIATMDGSELTRIRTAAVTAVAVLHLLRAGQTGGPSGNRPRIDRMAVIGTGIQGRAHALTLAAVTELTEVIVIGRSETAAARLAELLSQDGLAARPGTRSQLRGAGVVICASSSRIPVLHDHEVADDAVVAAIGAHGLANREIDPALARRCDVVVESRRSAFAESGDLIPAHSAREWKALGLTNLAELVTTGLTRRPRTPALYTGVGMSWQDLVIASFVFELASGRGTPCRNR